MASPNFTAAFANLGHAGRHALQSVWPKARIAPPVNPHLVAADIASLKPLAGAGGLKAYLAEAAQIPYALEEIGRLRETTFREAGEGTGKAVDLDRFDRHYLHLFLWNEERCEIVGAYRLCSTAGGPGSLYTSTLFRYDAALLTRLGPALELGRSFVRKEYQRSFAPLLLLWKAIGCYISRNPHYRTLFGPVSISSRYKAESRHLLMSYLEQHEWHEHSRLVRARHAPLRMVKKPLCTDLEDVAQRVAAMEPDGKSIPVLLRHYLKLGGKLLGFNVDREFGGALDGLIVVDLTRTEPRLLARYLGKAEAEAFLAHQKGTHGTPLSDAGLPGGAFAHLPYC